MSQPLPVLMALLLALFRIYEESITPSDAPLVPLGHPGVDSPGEQR